MTRIGQILCRNVPLSEHDIEEIVEEQKATRARFGDAAIALGVARPEDIWRAWIEQLQTERIEVDLDTLGVDTQALAHMPAGVAREHTVIPVRAYGDELVVACARHLDDIALAQIQSHCSKHIVVANAAPASVAREIERHYPETDASSSVAA